VAAGVVTGTVVRCGTVTGGVVTGVVFGGFVAGGVVTGVLVAEAVSGGRVAVVCCVTAGCVVELEEGAVDVVELVDVGAGTSFFDV
jgi:hypothetical protein